MYYIDPANLASNHLCKSLDRMYKRVDVYPPKPLAERFNFDHVILTAFLDAVENHTVNELKGK